MLGHERDGHEGAGVRRGATATVDPISVWRHGTASRCGLCLSQVVLLKGLADNLTTHFTVLPIVRVLVLPKLRRVRSQKVVPLWGIRGVWLGREGEKICQISLSIIQQNTQTISVPERVELRRDICLLPVLEYAAAAVVAELDAILRDDY